MAPLILNSLTEKDLLQQCLDGDRIAQKQIFELYAPKMMSVCKRYGRHRLEAEEIMQDGFVKVFTNLHKFEYKGSFEGWVRRIMVNTALKLVSKKSFKNEQIGLEGYQERSVDPSVYSKLSADYMLALVEKLPKGYRTVFNLSVLDGLSHREISEVLGIKESTSRSQLVKARNVLKIMIIELNKIAM